MRTLARGSGPQVPTTVASLGSALAQGALSGKPYAIIGLGMLLLMATPVVRVALSVVFFLMQKDWLYVAITVFVLTVLLLSLVTGIG